MTPFLDGQSGSISTVLLLIAAYIIGHLVSPLTKDVQRFHEKPDQEGFDSKKYEWLRVHQTEAGGHCVKFRAEFTMYNSFAAILLIYFILKIVEVLFWGYYHFDDGKSAFKRCKNHLFNYGRHFCVSLYRFYCMVPGNSYTSPKIW